AGTGVFVPLLAALLHIGIFIVIVVPFLAAVFALQNFQGFVRADKKRRGVVTTKPFGVYKGQRSFFGIHFFVLQQNVQVALVYISGYRAGGGNAGNNAVRPAAQRGR